MERIEQPGTKQCNAYDWRAHISFNPVIYKCKNDCQECDGDCERNKNCVKIPAEQKILQCALVFIFRNFRQLIGIELICNGTKIDSNNIQQNRQYTDNSDQPQD